MIEYSYNYWANSAPLFIGIFLWLLIVLAIFAIFKRRLILFLVLMTSLLVMLAIANRVISQRFINLNPGNLEITLVNGDVIKLNSKEINRFWGVRNSSKGVATSCYLWVQLKSGGSYRSVTIDNWGRCGKDAKYLNGKFNKY